MSSFIERNFTDLYISQSFQSVLQIFHTGSDSYILDLTGSRIFNVPTYGDNATLLFTSDTASLSVLSSSYAETASYALNAGSGGIVDIGSLATTGSNIFIGNQSISGSLNVSESITTNGFQFINSPTLGYVLTSDALGNASWQPSTSGSVVSSSYAQTASYLDPSHDYIAGEFINTRSGVITRDVDGYVSEVTKSGGRTIVFTRDVNNYIISASDGIRTYVFTRDVNNYVTSWNIT